MTHPRTQRAEALRTARIYERIAQDALDRDDEDDGDDGSCTCGAWEYGSLTHTIRCPRAVTDERDPDEEVCDE